MDCAALLFARFEKSFAQGHRVAETIVHRIVRPHAAHAERRRNDVCVLSERRRQFAQANAARCLVRQRNRTAAQSGKKLRRLLGGLRSETERDLHGRHRKDIVDGSGK